MAMVREVIHRTGIGSQEFKPNSRRLIDHLGEDTMATKKRKAPKKTKKPA